MATTTNFQGALLAGRNADIADRLNRREEKIRNEDGPPPVVKQKRTKKRADRIAPEKQRDIVLSTLGYEWVPIKVARKLAGLSESQYGRTAAELYAEGLLERRGNSSTMQHRLAPLPEVDLGPVSEPIEVEDDGMPISIDVYPDHVRMSLSDVISLLQK